MRAWLKSLANFRLGKRSECQTLRLASPGVSTIIKWCASIYSRPSASIVIISTFVWLACANATTYELFSGLLSSKTTNCCNLGVSLLKLNRWLYHLSPSKCVSASELDTCLTTSSQVFLQKSQYCHLNSDWRIN